MRPPAAARPGCLPAAPDRASACGTARGHDRPRRDAAEAIRGRARHLARQLRAAGMTPAQIAGQAEVSAAAIRDLLQSPPGPAATRRAAAAVLSMPIPPAGARRRLQALALARWPAVELAARSATPVPAAALHAIRHGTAEPVPAPLWSAICVLYAQLWNQPGPSAAISAYACTQGWAPAAAWDDNMLEAADAVPSGVPGKPPGRCERIAALIEDSVYLERTGLTLEQVADQIGIPVKRLERARLRHGVHRLRHAA
jgi:hypothetical protein